MDKSPQARVNRVGAALEQAVAAARAINEEDPHTTLRTGPLVAMQIPVKEWTTLVFAIRDMEAAR